MYTLEPTGCTQGAAGAGRAVAAMVTKSGRVRRPRAMSEDISSDDLASLDSGQVFALDQFAVDELVLVRNVNRQDDFWPAIVVDPIKSAPEDVRRLMQPDKLCVMFFGPAFNKIRPRDFCWACEGDVLPLSENFQHVQDKARQHSKGKRDSALAEAVQEALQIEQGEAQSTQLQGKGSFGAGHRGRPPGRPQDPTCVSCNITLNQHERENQVRYSGRCGNCQHLYEEGSFCPVCDEVWLPTDKNMVGCDNCSFWVHDHCDPVAARVLAHIARGDDEEPYMCPLCRKQAEGRAKLAALASAESAWKAAQPRHPRSAYNLFSMEIHKQYATDTGALDGIGYRDMARVVGETWRALTPLERGPYEKLAQKELQRFDREKRMYHELQHNFLQLQASAKRAGLVDETGAPKQSSLRVPPPPTLHSGLSAKHSGLSSRLGERPSGVSARPAERPAASAKHADRPDDRSKKRPAPTPAQSDTPKKQTLITPRSTAAAGTTEVLQRVPVYCGTTHGIFLLGRQRVLCVCPDCISKPEADREFSCTQFEQHAGAGAAKKWKASLRVEPGSVPESAKGSSSMSIGKWLELKGYDVKPNTAAKPPSGPSAPPAPSPAPPAEKKEKVIKEEKDKTPTMPFEPWLDVQKPDFKPVQVRWAGDRCSVCDSDVDFDFDQLVSCDMCGVTVHQTCYGVPELPGEDDMWLCRACELKDEGAPAPQCCLCPVSGGALKPASNSGLWCHATCMQWIPEVSVEDVTRMEPVSNITSIQKERWELMCCLCKQRTGAKIQCTSCYTAYHPLCARIAGLHMEILDAGDGADGSVRLISYCPRHCTARPEAAGVQIIGKDEVKGEGDVLGLWNCQPFRQPPAVPLPECRAGCARAQPLQDVLRKSHGTGIGFSSTAAFWIPDKPPEPAPAPQRMKQLGRPPKQPDGASKRSERLLGGRARDAGKLGLDRERNRAERRGMDRDSDDDREPPQAVELIQLPPNTPERVHVICNGRSGILTLRTQRVLAGGTEMSASRFETVCGKGDAKKWKCSIFLEIQPGVSGQVMQDWLNHRKLDRKALGVLSANLAAYEAYQEYVEEEVHAALTELLDALDPEGARLARTTRTPEEASDTTLWPAQPESKPDPSSQLRPPPRDASGAVPPPAAVKLEPAAQPQAAPAARAHAPPASHPPDLSGNSTQMDWQPGRAAPAAPSFVSNAHAAPAISAQWQPHIPTLKAANAAKRPKSPWDVPGDEEPGESSPAETNHPGDGAGPQRAALNQGLSWDRTHVPQARGDGRASLRRLSGDVLDIDAFMDCREGSPDGLRPGKSELRSAASQLRRMPMEHFQGRFGDAEDAAMPDGGMARLASDPFLSLPSIGEDGTIRYLRQGLSWQGSFLGGTGPLDEPFDFMTAEPSPRHSLRDPTGEVPRLGEPPQPAAATPADVLQGQKAAGGMSLRSSLRKTQQGSTSFQRPSAMPSQEAKPHKSDEHDVKALVQRVCGGGTPAGAGPQSSIGQRCRVYWPDDDDWYEGIVRDYDADAGQHNVWYLYDAEAEWLDLEAEHRAGRLRWVVSSEPVAASAQEAHVQGLPKRRQRVSGTGTPGVSMGDEPETLGPELVGRRIGIWWPEDACFYYGTVEAFSDGQHRLNYDDGDVELLDLAAEKVDWRPAPPRSTPQPPADGLSSSAAEGGTPNADDKDVPATVGVVCNDKVGSFDVKGMCIVMAGGRTVSATEFERLAGKAASKKWKSSIRVDKGKGVPGMTMGDWLVQMGLDQPRADRPKASAAPSMNAVRRRQSAMLRAAASSARPAGRLGHREGCMCVICKQARRTGKPWSGMGAGGAEAGSQALWSPRSGRHPASKAPLLRFGKQAFVRATPQLAGGPLRAHIATLPASHVWTAAEWEALKLSKASPADFAAEDRQRSSTPEPSALPGPKGLRRASAKADSSERGSAEPFGSNTALAAIKAEDGAEGSGGERKGSVARDAGGLRKREGGLTLKERLQQCEATEDERITFGKSGIHGWGFFARKPMKQDTMVIEYRGERLRRTVADVRERRYRAAGKDCYLFNVNDDTVVDATMKGTKGRFTNHCCAPSMYTKVLEVDGESRLVFFARTDLVPGQELTYDYRFKEEEGDAKMSCGCGAPNCRGYMN